MKFGRTWFTLLEVIEEKTILDQRKPVYTDKFYNFSVPSQTCVESEFQVLQRDQGLNMEKFRGERLMYTNCYVNQIQFMT